jgi:hypothetical protein
LITPAAGVAAVVRFSQVAARREHGSVPDFEPFRPLIDHDENAHRSILRQQTRHRFRPGDAHIPRHVIERKDVHGFRQLALMHERRCHGHATSPRLSVVSANLPMPDLQELAPVAGGERDRSHGVGRDIDAADRLSAIGGVKDTVDAGVVCSSRATARQRVRHARCQTFYGRDKAPGHAQETGPWPTNH